MVFVISSEAANTDSQVNLWFNVYIREGLDTESVSLENSIQSH